MNRVPVQCVNENYDDTARFETQGAASGGAVVS